MTTIALEFVPPSAAGGAAKAREEAEGAAKLLREAGLAERVNAVLVPGMIAEESDRPVPLEEKMDPLDVCAALAEPLPVEPIVTQVTAFDSPEALDVRVDALRAGGIRRAVFVGVPRTLADGEGPGVAPTEALGRYRGVLDGTGVIFIPTRPEEKPRFEAKAKAGASFALSQMLFSDHVNEVVASLELDEPKPEILLSFGYVPKAEQRVGLIHWLIRDETEAARRDMAFVEELSGMSFRRKKTALVDLYRRVLDGVRESGFPLGIHFECPYGFNGYAFEVFQAMLEHGTPDER